MGQGGKISSGRRGRWGSFIQFQLDLAVKPESGGDSTGESTGA